MNRASTLARGFRVKNRIAHLLDQWRPETSPAAPAEPERPGRDEAPRGPYEMPRAVNMLMPVELCLHRNLLVSLLSASITEMNRHKRSEPPTLSVGDMAELEAALQQQLAFRAWLRAHPSSFVSMALYPVSEANPLEEPDELGDLPS
jgi:hypothetical protein